jgi:cell division protein FtsQ
MTSFEIWRRLQQHQTVRPQAGRDWRDHGKKLFLFAGFALLMGALLIGSGKGIHNILSRSAFFQITSIKIEGARRAAKEEILKLSGVDIHSNLIGLDLRTARARIEEHGWIEQARIERHWPNGLTITIRERSPVALINLADGLYHLDRTGAIFGRVQPPADLDYPVITGLADREMAEGQETVKEALRFIALSSRGNPALPKQNISELHVGESGELTLFLVDKPFPIYLGRGEMVVKYSRLARVLSNLYRTGTFSLSSYIHLDHETDKVLVGTVRAG